MISGRRLGFRRRLWIRGNAATSSLSEVCPLLLRNPSRSSTSQSSVAAAVADPPPPISVAFLVDSCGLSPDSAAAAIKKLDLKGNLKAFRNPGAVVELFRSRGFSGAQIAGMVALQPRVLFSDAERTLKPKIDYLRAEGLSQDDIAKLIPFLSGSFEKTIKPNFEILGTILPSKSHVGAAVMRSRWLLDSKLKDTMLPNTETLRAIGVPNNRIIQLTMREAKVLSRPPRRFNEYVDMLKEVGLSHTTFRYIIALSALSTLSRATLQKKMSIFRNFGFTEEDFFSAFKTSPTIVGLSEQYIRKTVNLFKGFGLRDDEIPSYFGKKSGLLTYSEQNISKSMDFLVRTLDCKPRDVLFHPVLLTLSLKRRVIPRAFVRSTLVSKGLLSGDRLHYNLFLINEDKFLGKYVIKFRNELPQLLAEYEKLKTKGVRSSESSETSA